MLTKSARTQKVHKTFDLVGGGTLLVQIKEADNLAAMDSNGKSDPFCKLSANFSSQIYQTRTKKKTLSPVWDESFPIYVGDLEANHSITLKVYDRDFVGQDYLGGIVIKLMQLLNAENNWILEAWYPLENEPVKIKNKNEKKPGRIKVGLTYVPVRETSGTIYRLDPEKEYKFERILGKGAFGTVRKAIHKTTGDIFAAKIIDKRKIKPEFKTLLEREIHVMSRLHHPNIVSLEACYDTPKKVVLIMELVSGGELFKDIIARSEPYYEKDAADFVLQLFSALEYMHSLGIAHRDLKPENLLFSSDKKTIKISDFGFSKEETETLKTACGTALYVAPEVLSASEYDTSCDVWSIGVITYILLSAHIPFDGENEVEIFQKIMSAQYTFPKHLFGSVSDSAKDFISKIFVVDPKKRMTATDCLKHVWLNDAKSHSKDALPAFRTNIAKFNQSQELLKPHVPVDEVESEESAESDSDSDPENKH